MKKWVSIHLVIIILVACSPIGSQSTYPQTMEIEVIEALPMDCDANKSFALCVNEVTFVDKTMQILVEISLIDEQIQLVWPFAPADYRPPEDPVIYLVDVDGNKVEHIVDLTLPEPGEITREGTRSEQRFLFPSSPASTGRFTIHVPLVVVKAPMSGAVQLDLGPELRHGSSYSLDASVSLLGSSVVFDKAIIDEHGYFHLYSAPVDLGENIILRWLRVGMPEGWGNRIGPGNKYNFEEKRQHVWFPIPEDYSELTTGSTRIPFYGAVLYIIGPFEMTFEVP